LESTPDTVEDVIVEADGEWHTSDDRYASDAWKRTHRPVPPLASPTPHPANQAATKRPFDHVYDTSTQEKSQNSGDVVVLDSEEEDEGEVKRELSPSRPEHSPMNGLPDAQVIDLTVESDEESVSGRSFGRKRKAEVDPESPADEIWKKSRIGDPHATTVTRTMNGNVTTPASDVFVSGSNYGARHYAVNGASLQHRPHGTPFAPVSHASSPYTVPYFSQHSRVVTPSSGQFGPQVSHRTGYYS
jgi:E3 SUMO-protein ligase PIAS1